MTEERWEPVLDGPLAADAWAAVHEIAEALRPSPALAAESHGLALFWAYAAGALTDEVTAARYERAVDELVATIEAGMSEVSLYGGIAGAGWVMAHLADDSAEPFLTQVDDALTAELDVERWPGAYDLTDGLVGLGVYFLERLRAGRPAAAVRGLARVVDHLARLGEVGGDGTTWPTAPGLLPPWQRALAPEGYDNCGLAHGVPGVIALLGHAATTAALDDEPRRRARELGDRAARWLVAQQLPADPRGRFPSWVRRGHPATRARTAWCYGDPGVAAASWSAARRLGTATGCAEALARACAIREPALCGVRDAGLCHGALGLAHLHNRFFQASRDPVFRDAARAWFARGLAMRRPGEGVAGFLAIEGDDARSIADPGFLEGAAGIGLALLAGLQATVPGWDRLLLCDVPPAI